MNAPRRYALRFISGSYQGAVVPLTEGTEAVLGRTTDQGIELREDLLVSRRHARLFFEGDGLYIEDLNSTNGTFVNGERTRRARLREGDRVLVGESIFRLAFPEELQDGSREALEQVAALRRTSQMHSMAGQLGEVHLVDLLQLFGTGKKSGTLVLRDEDRLGKVMLRQGQIVCASINDDPRWSPLKCIFRLLLWTRGRFELKPLDEKLLTEELHRSNEWLIMEGLRQYDELREVRAKLPVGARLVPTVSPDQVTDPKERELLRLAKLYGQLDGVLDNTTLTDLEAAEIVLKLYTAGTLTANG